MKVSRIWRLSQIIISSYQLGIDQWFAIHGYFPRWLRSFSLKRKFEEPLWIRIRYFLEKLGPIYVKFGQMLSTRRDLISEELAVELSKLQDQVPPFSAAIAEQIIEKAYGFPAKQVFRSFNSQAVGSASIAQVHEATLKTGEKVAVKLLRPDVSMGVEDDISLLRKGAWWIEKFLPDGRRIRPTDIINEFAKILKNEQNLLMEAGNASLLKRNFSDNQELVVPEVYWDYCRSNIMVMEWMEGLPILPRQELIGAGIHVPQLAELGVRIFFKQIFRDGFFHADMHPGNILVTADGRYVALDFGIVGTLTDENRRYLAENFMGFFRRDYRRIAMAHIQAGWAPPETPVDEFEGAIRTVCEQMFDRPLSQLSFGHFLIQLFQLSRDFEIEIQPQLVLLQKTLLQIEGLGRQLDPSLDLWKTAKPYLEQWMDEQMGWRSLIKSFQQEVPQWGTWFPQFPRLIHQFLSNEIQIKNRNHKRKNDFSSNKMVLYIAILQTILLILAVVYFWL